MLYTKATILCLEYRKDKKTEFLSQTTLFKLKESSLQVEDSPKIYLSRTASHFSAIKDKLNTPYIEIEKESIDNLALLRNRIVILGDAGSGKSTELINTFHKLNKPDSPFVPIFQKLNTYTPEKGLEAYLPEFWIKVPQNLLLIIWDGLDEIQPEHFNTTVRQINSFSTKHKDLKILISCRTNFYDLPINNSTGTLPDFEPYFLNDLSVSDAIEYYEHKYTKSAARNFIKEVFDANLESLVNNPFFLMLLADQFSRSDGITMNRSDLYEMFLFHRINLDEQHYKSTLDLRSKKEQILLLLQKIALSMEILSANQISEQDILRLISSDEYNSLKYCTAFKKKDGEEYIWEFEHNNIQEFLAAKALSNLTFDRIVQFISFEPNYIKLIPSWANTLSFLFSILKVEGKLFKQLLKWLLDNEKETIVKFEPDKVLTEHRVQIFQAIFNYYKKHDLWISSNKFSDRELARFGSSKLNLQFLIDELRAKTTSRTVAMNAIRLLGHFSITDKKVQDEVEKILFNTIDQYSHDPHFIHAAIYAMKWAGLTKQTTINTLLDRVRDNKNQYVRAATYSILLDSQSLEDHIDYLIEGYEILDRNIAGVRDNTNLMDEGWNLKECVKNIKSPEGITKIIEYISASDTFDHGFDTHKVLQAIINNAINAYHKDQTVFDVILDWFKRDLRRFRPEKTDLMLLFFDETSTRERAFNLAWIERKQLKEPKHTLVVAKLLTPSLMKHIIEAYMNHELTKKDLEDIHFELGWTNNEARHKFEKLVLETTDYEIQSSQNMGHETLRHDKIRTDFNLLFNKDAFKAATLNIFTDQQKEVISFDELFEIKKENYKWTELDDYYPEVALRLLRDFAGNGQSVSKKKVEDWFDKEKNEELYRVSLIYSYLTSHHTIEVSPDQSKWIISWCHTNINQVNFREAIKVQSNNSLTFNTMALHLWYFSRKFSVQYSEDVLLDMLSFDFFEGSEWVGVDYLISKLDHSAIVNRMLHNIQHGILHEAVLKNHIKYLSQFKIVESYSHILKEITNLRRRDYQRQELLDIFFEYTKDIDSLKSIINQSDSAIKWSILSKLKANNEESFVESYLLKSIKQDADTIEVYKAAEMLITLQNIQGLKIYVGWIKRSIGNELDAANINCLSSLKTTEAIPYLVELLELSYVRDIKLDRFESLNAQVLGAFHNIALISDENFILVKSTLQEFITEKSSIHSKVKYILYNIERMDEQHYMDHAQSYTIQQVKKKLHLLDY